MFDFDGGSKKDCSCFVDLLHFFHLDIFVQHRTLAFCYAVLRLIPETEACFQPNLNARINSEKTKLVQLAYDFHQHTRLSGLRNFRLLLPWIQWWLGRLVQGCLFLFRDLRRSPARHRYSPHDCCMQDTKLSRGVRLWTPSELPQFCAARTVFLCTDPIFAFILHWICP